MHSLIRKQQLQCRRRACHAQTLVNLHHPRNTFAHAVCSLSNHASGKTVALGDGLVLRHFTVDELNFLYREVFVDRVYLRHGVSLRPGDTVVDVGANTGLFTLLAAEEVGPGGRVVALEPLPATFDLLRANVAAHAEWLAAKRGLQAAAPVLLNCGAGAPGLEQATFVSYSGSASGWSTMYPDDEEVRANMRRYLENLMAQRGQEREGGEEEEEEEEERAAEGAAGSGGRRDAAGTAGEATEVRSRGDLQPPPGRQQQQQPATAAVPEPLLAGLARALWRGAPPLRPLLRAAGDLYVSRMLSGQRQWRCRLVPLSRLIREQGLGRIDLLKVDVERAELDVLAGLEAAEWPRVRQVVMEVHDLDGRLAAVRELLLGAGFARVVSEQDTALAGSTLHVLYAVRE